MDGNPRKVNDAGHEPQYEKFWNKQVTWNKKMATLFKADGVIKVHEAPDYSLKALEAWTVSQSITVIKDGTVHAKVLPNAWWREMHALLQREPKSMRGFSFMPKGEVV